MFKFKLLFLENESLYEISVVLIIKSEDFFFLKNCDK